MDLDVVFLGTSASAPIAQRAPTALLVRRGGDPLLFDCAEGSQRQLGQKKSVSEAIARRLGPEIGDAITPVHYGKNAGVIFKAQVGQCFERPKRFASNGKLGSSVAANLASRDVLDHVLAASCISGKLLWSESVHQEVRMAV